MHEIINARKFWQAYVRFEFIDGTTHRARRLVDFCLGARCVVHCTRETRD